MTQQETNEGNRLIVEFMKGKKDCYGKWFYQGYVNGINFLGYEIDGFKYNSSWDWLMPVVEKIETLDKMGGVVQIQQAQVKITSRMAGDSSVYADISKYVELGVKGKLLATWLAVIEFIKSF